MNKKEVMKMQMMFKKNVPIKAYDYGADAAKRRKLIAWVVVGAVLFAAVLVWDGFRCARQVSAVVPMDGYGQVIG